ncbi:MAG: hypothetical protein IJ806_02540 [Ruminococcus sp.]|nr:hypothetical protein [Ruminococcus sp.]
MNSQLTELLLKVAGKCVIVMVFIALACIVTPKIAAWIQKNDPKTADRIERGKLFVREEEDTEIPQGAGNTEQVTDPEKYEVHGAFESSKLEDFDPNYKIYNSDIYGVELKNGKKQKNG